MISSRVYRSPLKIQEALQEVYQGAGLQFDSELVHALTKKPFWQVTTYYDLGSLQRQIDEERKWLARLANFYATLAHPLVHAQSRWLDRLVVMSFRLRYVGRRR